MARRGYFAERQHQAMVAARDQERAARAEAKARKAAAREAERALKAEERAAAQLARANEKERKQLEKQARETHIAAMEAEVERRNLELAAVQHEIDSLLAATLDVDDYVDLDKLRTTAEHPPFDRSDLETPVPTPDPIPDPPKPVNTPPVAAKGIKGLFGRKKHQAAVAEARNAHAQAIAAWRIELVALPSRRQAAADEHDNVEAQRVAELKAEKTRYAAECSDREMDAAAHNKAIDELIANLGYGTVDAVQEYVSIVLSCSVYPKHFSVNHSFTFEASVAELGLRVVVPRPDSLPDIKAYKYTKSSDEITSTTLSQKACNERYTGAVHQVALRSLHEIFEADRREIIKTISLEVGTETADPATGRQTFIPFVATGAERDSFMEFDLSGVVPTATLEHLGAALSKNPIGLLAASGTGVRRS